MRKSANKEDKKVAVVIQNLIQFYTLKEFIDSYKNAIIHIFIPQREEDESGFNEIFETTYNYLKNKYPSSIYRGNNGLHYNILLEPYYIDPEIASISADYKIKYKYSAISAKTNPSYSPEFNSGYDAILCYSNYEKDLLSIYAKTYLVGKLNYCKFKKEKNRKKTVLYLPTYGAVSSLKNDLDAFRALKREGKYKVIIKLHHGTVHLASESINSAQIEEVFDDILDEKTPLENILAKADVVVSDNSGSLFEAIYAGVPVCSISAVKTNNQYNGLYPLQDSLRKSRVIPYRKTVTNISSLIKETLSKETIEKQMRFRREQFPLTRDELLDSFTKVIDYFLQKNIAEGDKRRIQLRRILDRCREEQTNDLRQEVDVLSKEVDVLSKEVIILNKKLKEYDRCLYRTSAKIYRIVDKSKRKESS